jgi:hypothetical protein
MMRQPADFSTGVTLVLSGNNYAVSVVVRVGLTYDILQTNSRQLACIRQVQGPSHGAWKLLSKSIQMYSFPSIHPIPNINSEVFPCRFKELECHHQLAWMLWMRGYLPPYCALFKQHSETKYKGAKIASLLHCIRIFHFNNKWMQYRALQRAVGPLWFSSARNLRARAHQGNWLPQHNHNFRELLSAWVEHMNGAVQIEENALRFPQFALLRSVTYFLGVPSPLET